MTVETKFIHRNSERPRRSASSIVVERKPYVYTVQEIQQLLHLSRSKVRQLVAEGAFGPTLHVGRAVRIPAVGVERWLNAQLDLARDPTAARSKPE